MSNSNPHYLPDPHSDTNRAINHSASQQSPKNNLPVSQQQKRQHSLSNYMPNNSNKRMPNPTPSATPSQQPSSQDHSFSSTAAVTSQHQSQQPQSSSRPQNRNSFRRSVLQQQYPLGGAVAGINSTKTPTPSSYEVPSSPNVNQSLSVQNISDSPDSNPPQDHQQGTSQPQGPVKDSSQLSDPEGNTSTFSAAPTASNHSATTATKASQPREMTEEEQQLATKLKDTYKNIVNYEEIVQKNCLEISLKISQFTNNSHSMTYGNSPIVGIAQGLAQSSPALINNVKSSELSNELWNVYHNNISLLDNYTDFLVTALKPTSNDQRDHFKTGKNIVDLYKIPRRMWVYGVVAFLEVLKNIINIFQEHEICSSFIGHCFTIISNLTDPVLDMEGWWSEKLGDLSRMAIALYSSRFIDWKVSAEHWYFIAMRTLYGHGKIYYHMCTVQQDNLDALVNIGKSVICRDPFVPTQQYLRLVVENICTQRNILSILELPIIDFIKIHKVLLSINTNQLNSNKSGSNSNNGENNIENLHETQLQYGIDLVSRYGITFGSDSNGYNFFTRQLYTPNGVTNTSDPRTPYYLQQQLSPSSQNGINSLEKLNFWLNKGPLFAIANINHIVGLGDSKNPFAKIFLLPEALKERKDKKDRKRKSKSSIAEDFANANSSSVNSSTISASEISEAEWVYYLKDINKSVLELSVRILKHYLVGPIEASYGHVIIWLYFLIAVGEATEKHPESKPLFFWLFKYIFPWDLLINYLNTLLIMVKSNDMLLKRCRDHILNTPNYIQYFNDHENLAEVWKCWGTLWFDFISAKTDYCEFDNAGISDYNIFDLPVSGISASLRAGNNLENLKSKESPNFDDNNIAENNDRIIRIILLSRYLADHYEFGLVRSHDGFKYWGDIVPLFSEFVPQEVEFVTSNFLYGDNRFISHSFFDKFSDENAYTFNERISIDSLDDEWFERNDSLSMFDSQGPGESRNAELGDAMEDFGEDLEQERRNKELEDQVNKLYNQQHEVLKSNLNDDEFYNTNFMINPENLSIISENNLGTNNVASSLVEGNLGDRMDTSLTYITLDTNIWLKHCGRIFKCIRNGVFKILIPLIVFQELRSLRKSSEVTIADAATRSVIIIRELHSAQELLPLRFDGTIASDINETTEFENNSNWRANIDETIMKAVNEQNEISRKVLRGLNSTIAGKLLDTKLSKSFCYCILITDDRNMRLRAKTIGVTSFQSKWLFSQLEGNFYSKCID
ncbi:hypothetical protein CANTEDRAFT_104645 [Yamadazyma tenuis ATCC 10573]|uniref:PIN domain-containing protein n=1 Tax=Candida tenuis (strain ATCC 10573 / BCRC 21748 / CBS 615 / JCM 9827 / NBRC 10315 / NRRL Y-1498 / VKM Y-70) TaxID=590646 RepID=G3B423_CANTC|nr:uncharacterized protein CANTEDRAFT_104645 [Yamadazyma tenuis ATCC 10573]EGV63754.1 hypothetical protein CANTEDRAFT_104645 [Yamadazyma tenuis ATCC 10573]